MTFDITATELQRLIQAPNNPQQDPLCLIDVREPHEWQKSHIEGAQHIPLKELTAHIHELNPQAQTVLYCRSGVRSQQALQLLKTAGFSKLHNLAGGILAWQSQIDPDMPVW